MNKIKNKLLFILLFSSLIPVLLISGYTLFSTMDSMKESSMATHKNRVKQVSEYIDNYLSSITSDLFYLRDSNALHLYLGALDSGKSHSERLLLTNLRSSFHKFSDQKKNYQQVRFINTQGFEIVRIDRANSVSKNVSNTLLQDKSSHQYFKQVIKMPEDELYISDIKLNRENNKVEVPLKPTIHYATPVFDKHDVLQGIVILNIMLDPVFNFIKEQEDDNEELSFSDIKGHYYYHHNANKRWGSINDLNTNITIYSDHPELKDTLMNSMNLSTFETDDGVVTYKAIMLNKNRTHLGNIISIAPTTIVYKSALNFLYAFLGIMFLILALSFSLSLFLSHSITRPLLKLTESVNKLSQGDLDTPIEVTSNDEIKQLAHEIDLLRKSMKILIKRSS